MIPQLHAVRGSKEGRYLFELSSQAIGIIKISKVLVIGCMDSTLNGYSLKVFCRAMLSPQVCYREILI